MGHKEFDRAKGENMVTHSSRVSSSRTIGSLIAAGALLATTTMHAQSPQEFEVASVKKSQTTRGGMMVEPSGRFVANGVSLLQLIRVAHGFQGLQIRGQIIGGPSWLESARFDVEAKAAGKFTAGAEGTQQILAMLKSLLAERFRLKVHTETRQMSMYALVVARPDKKLGPKLRPSTVACPGPGEAPTDTRWCGIRGGPGKLDAKGITLFELTVSLANFPAISRTIRDETGLEGRYDWQLEWVPTFVAAESGVVENRSADNGPNLFTALQDQLGLKLQGIRGPVDVLVIDSVDALVEN
jgi:uncharacterized protein (TIGR03435 family)